MSRKGKPNNSQLIQRIIEKQEEQEMFNEEVLEKHEAVMKELNSMKNEQSGRKRRREDGDCSTESPVKRAEEEEESEARIEKPSAFAKQIVLKHVFKNASSVEESKCHFSPPMEHFGVAWKIGMFRTNGHLDVIVNCMKPYVNDEWKIKADLKVDLIGNNGHICLDTMENEKFINVGENRRNSCSCGLSELLKWEVLKEEYLINDTLTIRATVRLYESEGIYKPEYRSFDDESMQDVSDITLIVNDKKFYVSKLFLAAQSSFFKAMCLGSFGESNKSEITLTGIDADDFQKYLEVLYGEPAIDDWTVEGIILVADMYDTPVVTRRCETFLWRDSKKTTKTKLELAAKYHLNDLKNACLSKIRNLNDIRSVLPSNIWDMDHSLMAALFEKAVFPK